MRHLPRTTPLLSSIISAEKVHLLGVSKGWGQIVKLKKSKKYLYDLGETLPSCSGIHPEVLDQVIPKSHK